MTDNLFIAFKVEELVLQLKGYNTVIPVDSNFGKESISPLLVILVYCLRGSSERVCLENGSWTGVTPSCIQGKK